MNKPWWESPACWLCDYGVFVMVALLILGIGAYRFLYAAEQTVPAAIPTPITLTYTPTHAVATSTHTPQLPTEIPFTPTFTVTSTPVVEKPEFILVFVPVNWGLSQSEFRQEAQRQADVFISESGVENYFAVTVVALENGIDDVSLGSDTLVYDILEFALQEQPGDRYIGLTDGDVSPDGDSDVVGWTSGGSAMIAEYDDEYVVTHELGHTFGLCDEYSYSDWSRQNEEYEGGCPNPYPKNCPREESDEPICEGAPAADGSNSIMGPAGISGSYSFNKPSYQHLQDVFRDLSGGDIP